MRKVGRRGMCSVASAVACGALLAVLWPTPASARQKVIQPWQLRPVLSIQADIQEPFAVGSQGGSVTFWAPVSLPIGAVVKRIVYQHASNNVSASTRVRFERVKLDATPALQTIANRTVTDITGAPYNFQAVSEAALSGVRKVQAGWRYGVKATIFGADASIGWIKIIY